jgi:hypothetical protein
MKMDLNILARTLSERLMPDLGYNCKPEDNCAECPIRLKTVEAVIREAIDKTLEEAAQLAINLATSVPSRMTEDGEETVDYICRTTDVLDEIEDEYKEHANNHELTLVGFIASKVLEARDRQHEIAEAIRSLKQSNSAEQSICPKCRGRGYCEGRESETVECMECKGKGKQSNSGMEVRKHR